MIAKALIWLVYTYLTLKLIQYVFGGRPGFRNVELSFGEKLRRGEPLLFAVAFAISVPLALGTSWYVQRGYKRAFTYSTDCYGRLQAVDALAEVRKGVDAYQVYTIVRGSQGAALLAAQSLEMRPAAVDKILADKKGYYSHHYAGLARQGDRREIGNEAAAIGRCLSQPLIQL